MKSRERIEQGERFRQEVATRLVWVVAENVQLLRPHREDQLPKAKEAPRG